MNLQNRFAQWYCGADLWNICVYGSSGVVRDNAEFCEYFIDSLLVEVESYLSATGGFDDLAQLTTWLVEATQVFAIETEMPLVFRSVIMREGMLHVFIEFEMQSQPTHN